MMHAKKWKTSSSREQQNGTRGSGCEEGKQGRKHNVMLRLLYLEIDTCVYTFSHTRLHTLTPLERRCSTLTAVTSSNLETRQRSGEAGRPRSLAEQPRRKGKLERTSTTVYFILTIADVFSSGRLLYFFLL